MDRQQNTRHTHAHSLSPLSSSVRPHRSGFHTYVHMCLLTHTHTDIDSQRERESRGKGQRCTHALCAGQTGETDRRYWIDCRCRARQEGTFDLVSPTHPLTLYPLSHLLSSDSVRSCTALSLSLSLSTDRSTSISFYSSTAVSRGTLR